jgi:hypothetical protein
MVCLKTGIICSFVVFLAAVRAFGALDTADIDRVMKKEVLQQQDLTVIDNFVGAGVQELLNTRDFSSVGNLRTEIVARAHSSQTSADIQYHPQFIAAAEKNLDKAFDDAKKISDAQLRSRVMLNLMILLDNLSSPKLANLALTMIGDDDASVRYWAVHAVTNPSIIEQLNSGKAGAGEAQAIASRLEERTAVETSPYILAEMVKFGGMVKAPQAQELLMRIADARLKDYQSGKTGSASLDETVLKMLADKIAAGQDKAGAAWRFGQLLSYAMQLYIRDMGGSDAVQRDELGDVLSQAETMLIKLQIPQTGIKRAVDRKDKQALQTEYKELFGEGTTPGKFTTALNVEYPSPDGTKRKMPLPLPEEPKTAK